MDFYQYLSWPGWQFLTHRPGLGQLQNWVFGHNLSWQKLGWEILIPGVKEGFRGAGEGSPGKSGCWSVNKFTCGPEASRPYKEKDNQLFAGFCKETYRCQKKKLVLFQQFIESVVLCPPSLPEGIFRTLLIQAFVVQSPISSSQPLCRCILWGWQ